MSSLLWQGKGRKPPQLSQSTPGSAGQRSLAIDGNQPPRRDLARALQSPLLRHVDLPAGVGGVTALTQAPGQPPPHRLVACPELKARKLGPLLGSQPGGGPAMLAPQERGVEDHRLSTAKSLTPLLQQRRVRPLRELSRVDTALEGLESALRWGQTGQPLAHHVG